MIRLDIINFILCIIILIIITIYIIVNISNSNKSKEKYTDTQSICPFKSKYPDNPDHYYSPGGADCPVPGQNDNKFLLVDTSGNISTSNMSVQNFCDFQAYVNHIDDNSCTNAQDISTITTKNIPAMQASITGAYNSISTNYSYIKSINNKLIAGIAYEQDYFPLVIFPTKVDNISYIHPYGKNSSGISSVILANGFVISLYASTGFAGTFKKYTNNDNAYLMCNFNKDTGIYAFSYNCEFLSGYE